MENRFINTFHNVYFKLISAILFVLLTLRLLYLGYYEFIFPSIIMIIGATFNLIAVFSNNKKMPVTTFKRLKKNVNTPIHDANIKKEDIKYYYLTDIINVIIPKRNNKGIAMIISIGDILLFIGILTMPMVLL